MPDHAPRPFGRVLMAGWIVMALLIVLAAFAKNF